MQQAIHQPNDPELWHLFVPSRQPVGKITTLRTHLTRYELTRLLSRATFVLFGPPLGMPTLHTVPLQ